MTIKTHEKLHDWFADRLGDPDKTEGEARNGVWAGLSYGRAAIDQVMFVRDKLPLALYNTWTFRPQSEDEDWSDYKARKPEFLVIGSHLSKSCELPVYYLKLNNKDGQPIEIVMRNNFHDWNISIRSAVPLKGLFTKLISETITYCFFQGFPKEFEFGPYSNSNQNFSFFLDEKNELWTILWLLFNESLDCEPSVNLETLYI